MKKLYVGLLMVFAFCSAHAETPLQTKLSSQIRIPVEKYKLDNGLTVLLHEDHSLPIISYHTWFRVGSRHERPGITGIAHMFEHLMFKGTKKYPNKKFDELLQANGATNNAFTSHDYTGYYENFPSDKLELIMDIESDRMVNLELNEEMLGAEREVVKEERRMRVDNRPGGVLYENIYRTVFRVHPYRWPVIGWMKDISSYKLEDFKQWYKTYYAPSNAVLVIAGDFDTSKVKKMIQKYYGPLKAQPLPEQKYSSEPVQSGFRQQVVTKDVQAPLVSLAYRGPAASDKDTYALDLLGRILGSGTSSRLYTRLVYRNKKATSVGAYNASGKDPGVFQVRVSLKPGVPESQIQQALLGEIYKMRSTRVSEQELQKAKNQTMLSYVSSMKTVDGKANILALNEILFGDYSEFFKDLDRYNQVTAIDIQEVAKKYLTPKQASWVVVKPRNVSANTQGVQQ